MVRGKGDFKVLVISFVSFFYIALVWLIYKINLSPLSSQIPFIVDYFEYHSIAVNFLTGNGFHIFGGIESLDTYNFNFNITYQNNDLPTTDLLFRHFVHNKGLFYTFKEAGYPFILSVIYFFNGISFSSVVYYQIFFLGVSALYLQFTLLKTFENSVKNQILIVLVTCCYFISNIDLSMQMESEAILIPLVSILCIYYYNNNKVNEVYLGIALGILITLKSTLIFVPIVYVVISSIKQKRINVKLLMGFLLVSIPYLTLMNISGNKVYSGSLENFTYEMYSNDDLLVNYISSSNLNAVDKQHLINNNFNSCQERYKYEEYFNYKYIELCYFTISNKNFFFFTTRPKDLIIDTNNELIVDDIEKWFLWKYDPESWYNNHFTNINNQVLKVVLFYLHNPIYFIRIMSFKLIIGLINSPFILLYIFSLPNSRKSKLIFLFIFVFILLLNFVPLQFFSWLSLQILAAILIIIILFFYRNKIFSLSDTMNLSVIINTTLFVFITISADRIIKIMEMSIILLTVNNIKFYLSNRLKTKTVL